MNIMVTESMLSEINAFLAQRMELENLARRRDASADAYYERGVQLGMTKALEILGVTLETSNDGRRRDVSG